MIWRWLIAFLTWLAADPTVIDTEPARAAAAVAAARASLLVEAAPVPPAPGPKPPAPGKCCGECGGRGYVVMPDGHRVVCPCPSSCPCKSKACPDGKCPTPAGKVLR
jgi:hypothetical protein